MRPGSTKGFATTVRDLDRCDGAARGGYSLATMPAGRDGTGEPAPRRRSKVGSRTIRPGQTLPPVLPRHTDRGTVYGGPTAWSSVLAARLVFWFKGRALPSARLVASSLIIAYLGWCLLPPLVLHYQLHDDVVDIARRPLDDGETLRLIKGAIERRGVTKRLDAAGITLRTSPSGTRRNVDFSYQAELSVVPGLSHMFKVSIDVSEPVLFRPEPKHF